MLGSGDDIQIVNCTMVANRANDKHEETGGGAIAMVGASHQISVLNSILIDNVPQSIRDLSTGSVIITSHCNFDDAWPGPGNISDGALFMDRYGPDNILGTIDDDLSIRSYSPCADSGDNTLVPVDVLTDLAGNPRFADDPNSPDIGSGTSPLVDMGCYEVQPQVAPPNPCPADSAPPGGNGVVNVEDLLNVINSWGLCPN